MRVVKGNKIDEIGIRELSILLEKFRSVEIDLGTGDGRFAYKNAIDNSEIFYIGVDPSEKQLQVYSRKAVRKKLNNVLFAIGSVELLPPELAGKADKVHITLPWGSLLQKLVVPEKSAIFGIKNLLKKGGDLNIVLGFSPDLEPSESRRLSLPEITLTYLQNETVPAFEKAGLKLLSLNSVESSFLKNLESTWGRKIGLTKQRPLFIMQFTRE